MKNEIQKIKEEEYEIVFLNGKKLYIEENTYSQFLQKIKTGGSKIIIIGKEVINVNAIANAGRIDKHESLKDILNKIK